MKYMGSKNRIAKEILPIMLKERGQRTWVEPFVGGANVIDKVQGNRIGNDNQEYVIALYKALQNGWLPPEEVSEELYAEYKRRQDNLDPLTAFIGIGCSFGGKWFGGYVRQKGYNFAAGGKRALQKQLPFILDVHFFYKDYREWYPKNKLIYCDPPY